MANSVTARFNDDCKVFVSMSDDTTVEKAVIIDAEGNETDIGGGGGSSDFSTATVTLINNGSSDGYKIALPILTDENGIDFASDIIVSSEVVVQVPLYKGKLKLALLISNVTQDVPTVSGDIFIDDHFTYLLITGDGTFTATASHNA